METKRTGMIKGLAVSAGIARGTAVVVSDEAHLAVPRRAITEAEVEVELAKFAAALGVAEQTLAALQKEVLERIGKREADIFEAQKLMLRDPSFVSEVSSRCSSERINVEAALADVIERFVRMFEEIDDDYVRHRAGDVLDVGRRVLGILLKQTLPGPWIFPEGKILVASELLASTTARLDLKTIRAVVTERGGKTSHASILTRSLGIPAVIAAKDATKRIRTGDALIVDGLAGTVFVNPKGPVLKEYTKLEGEFRAYQNALKDFVDLPAITQDGVTVRLCANIGKLADAEAAFLCRAEGIGLYRTEFGFLIRDQCPTPDEQFQIYETVAARMHPREVVIRLLDVGGDKTLPYFPLAQEANPSLGLRGTRLLLKHQELLKSQLGAILRVSANHPVAVLFPAITSLEEVLESKKVFEQVKAALKLEGQPFNLNIRVGAMIEIPSAAMMAKQIAHEVDFLSIGTNDLIQYLLAADRASPEMTAYYEPLHPAVLQTLKWVIAAAHTEGKDVAICGEMAGNMAYTELLLGMGARSFSVTPGEILEIKRVVRSLSVHNAEPLAAKALGMGTVQEIKHCLNKMGTQLAWTGAAK